jgi:hypothetical protein
VRNAYPIRRRLSGLGYPVLPDSFTTAAGVPESFSPQTADATVVSILQSQGQQLPAALAAKWAAAQANPATTPAVTASGTPVSTQTGAAITLLSTIAVAPGVWSCVMSDGTSHYCDQNQNPISYTPPPPPVATPAATSQPTSTVAPAVTPAPTTVPATTPAAVTPSGAPISTTTGAPTSGTLVSTVGTEVDSLVTWLEGSLIGGIPNWVLLGGAVAGLMMFGGDGGGSSRRRR